ncbi:MAG: type I-A CRISPR-associated protein Cas4/Csa1 [Candidatus Aenigmatarchaeota archaeon]
MYYVFGESVESFLGFHLRKAQELQIPDELRGWNLEPTHYEINLPVWMVAGKYCPTCRDVYLSYVKGVKPLPTPAMMEGRLYHETLAEIVPTAKEYIYTTGITPNFNLLNHMQGAGKRKVLELVYGARKDIERAGMHEEDVAMIKYNMLKLWNFESMQIAANVDMVMSRFPNINRDSLVSKAIPLAVEQKLDGSRIGLSSQLSIDALMVPQAVIFDMKTGKSHRFHLMTTTGYALAYEAEHSEPVNIGCIVYPTFRPHLPIPSVKKKPHLITAEMRKEFIDLLRAKTEIVAREKDPGMPPACPQACPYYLECHPIPYTLQTRLSEHRPQEQARA